MLVWNETDLIECLETVPEHEEDGVWHTYRVDKDGLSLMLTIYQFDSDVYIDLYREGIERPIFAVRIVDCPGVRYVKDKRGEFIEFAASKCFGTKYDGESPIPYGVRVSVKPSIQVMMF